MIPAEAAQRFRADFAHLGDWHPPICVAVSGGADSLALLLLAHAAFPGQVLAATVDHGLRAAGAGEAQHVAAICAAFRVDHEVLAPVWAHVPSANVQAEARAARYHALRNWAARHHRDWVATAHHADDQAETLLMRLSRGAGAAGLAGIRPCTTMRTPQGDMMVLRPLLGWRKMELAAIVEQAGLQPVDDPSNNDERFDRTRVRQLLAGTPWLQPERLAASAAHLADCEAALDWAARQVQPRHLDDGAVEVDAAGLPREIQRRLLVSTICVLSGARGLPGPKVARLLARLNAGSGGTLADILVRPGPLWRFERAPLRRSSP